MSAVAAKREERIERRKQEIMRKAAVLLRTKDYFGFSVDDLCAELKINKTTFYRYFVSKESMLYELHKSTMHEIEAMVAAILETDAEPDVKLVAVIEGQVVLQQRPGVSALSIPQLYVFSPRLRREVLHWRDRYQAEVRGLIQDGVDRGIFETPDVALYTKILLGTLNSVQNWYSMKGRLTAAQLADSITEALFQGLRKR